LVGEGTSKWLRFNFINQIGIRGMFGFLCRGVGLGENKGFP